MSRQAVHWHEGMFLRPHHFQAATRHLTDQIRQQVQWDDAYSWGLRLFDLDVQGLNNYRFAVNRLRARLRDGTLVSIPEDGKLADLDLRRAFTDRNEVTVSLGVPEVMLNRPNVGKAEDPVRFRVVTNEKLPDENTGGSEQRIDFRTLNPRLLTDDEDSAGYQIVKLATIEKSVRQDAVPQLSESYIPAVLACDAWRPLQEKVLTPIFDRVGQLLKQRAEIIRGQNVSFESSAAKDRERLEMLRVLNHAYSVMQITHFAEGMHPLQIYTDLARFIGELAIFDRDRRETPDLPRYDHDDLGNCFFTAKRLIEKLLNPDGEDEYYMQELRGAGLQIQGKIKPEWLHPNWAMFIGVQAPLTASECKDLLTNPKNLNMKIASTDVVESIFTRGQRGLIFQFSERPPRVLPAYHDLFYFQIDRNVQPDEWKRVESTLSMGVRINEDTFRGNIDRQHKIKVFALKKEIPVSFTLYILPPGLNK